MCAAGERASEIHRDAGELAGKGVPGSVVRVAVVDPDPNGPSRREIVHDGRVGVPFPSISVDVAHGICSSGDGEGARQFRARGRARGTVSAAG